MKKIKTLAAFAVLSVVSGFAFAESEFAFTNKLSSDVVVIETEGDNSDTSFAGFKNQTTFEFTSKKVDAVADLTFWSTKETDIKNPLDLNDDKDYFAIGTNDSFDFGDSYIEVRPFDFLGFEFHEKVMTAGSYLPVWDDNASSGNIASDFGVLVRPFEGFVFGAGVDFISAFGHDDKKPLINLGLEYANDSFAVGGVVRNVAGEDDFSFGVFGSLLSVDNLVLNFGFAYNDAVEPDVGAVSGNLLLLGGTYEKDSFHSAWDFATNFASSDDNEFDFYIAAAAGYNVTDDFSADCELAAALDAESDENKKADARFQVKPFVTYTLGNHEFSAGVNVIFGEDYLCVNFPVHWKYSFQERYTNKP